MGAFAFNLAGMESALNDARKYTAAYSEAITSLDQTIKELENDWMSSETGTYQTFAQNYMSKRDMLFDARDKMNEFCRTLEAKMIEFGDTDKSINNYMNSL